MSGPGLRCYQCGASLDALSLPLGRLEECPECTTQLHVCRMCRSYEPRAIDACTEDDAPAVQNKRNANFCEYFKPTADAFTGRERALAERAAHELASLFGKPPTNGDPPAQDDAQAAADALFRRPER